MVLRYRITIGSWASGLCALQFSMIRRTWRPAMRASNDFSHSLKMACVIYALLFFRYLQPMVSMLMFLEQHGHFDFPLTRSSSVSLPLPLRHTAKMIRALICLRPSRCLVASKLSACEQVYISTKCHKMFQTRPLA